MGWFLRLTIRPPRALKPAGLQSLKYLLRAHDDHCDPESRPMPV
jgi:hypothetical protein